MNEWVACLNSTLSMTDNWNLGFSSRLSTGPPGTCFSPFRMPTSQTQWWVLLMHITSPSSDSKKSRGQPCPFYVLVSEVSYSLSLRSSKMSTSTLALPSLSGARLMRFLARVMESRSPLLHSMGSSKIAAVGRQPHGDSWYPLPLLLLLSSLPQQLPFFRKLPHHPPPIPHYPQNCPQN